MKDGVLEPNERTGAQIKHSIKRLKREFEATGVTGEMMPPKFNSDLDHERYLTLQIQAHKDRLGDVTDAQFEEWLGEQNAD